MPSPLIPDRNMLKTNNCLKISWWRWAPYLRLTQALQILYSFLDIKQKSHEQVFLRRNLAGITYRLSDKVRKNLVNIASNIAQ